MGLLSWLGLTSEREVSQRVIIEYATVQEKRVVPAHTEAIAPLQFNDGGNFVNDLAPYPLEYMHVPEQYELVLDGEVRGRRTYRGERDEFRRMCESLAMRDRVEVSYIPRVLSSDTIVSVQKARD